LIARFSSVQANIQFLSNYEVGYAPDKFCALNVPPEILSFSIDPSVVSSGQRVTLRLRAQVASREGFSPLASVKVDLTPLGGLPDAEMFDDGTHGDDLAQDQTYSLNLSFTPKETGEKKLDVVATDKLGWEDKKEASLLIVE